MEIILKGMYTVYANYNFLFLKILLVFEFFIVIQKLLQYMHMVFEN